MTQNKLLYQLKNNLINFTDFKREAKRDVFTSNTIYSFRDHHNSLNFRFTLITGTTGIRAISCQDYGLTEPEIFEVVSFIEQEIFKTKPDLTTKTLKDKFDEVYRVPK